LPAALVPSGSGSVTVQPTGASQVLAAQAQQGTSGNQDASAGNEAGVLKKEGSVKELGAGEMAPVSVQKPAEAGELSHIEKTLVEDSLAADKSQPQQFSVGKVVQFGYDFFRPEAAGFAPLVDVPVGPDYVLGTGDRILLTLWGSIEGTYELEINRAGEIVLPKVGSMKVAGQTYGQLPELLKSQLGSVFKDFQLNLNMGKLRLIKVYLVGQVKAPGDYNVSSLTTVINALAVAGGPTKSGTLRSIQVKRNGKLVETVDLYDFFLKGDKSRDIRLQPGDTIFVPAIGPVAGIAGNVRNPAIYELLHEKTLKDLLALADGIRPTGYLQRIQISRIEANDKKIVSDINLGSRSAGQSLDDLTAGIRIQDLDMVKVFPIDSTLRGYARLEGYVLRPGDYALKPGMRVSELLGQDNLLPEYSTEAGQITRLFPPDFHAEVIFFNVAKAISGDPSQNLELHEFDRVRIFSRWEMEEIPSVRISGDVQKPGQYRQFNNMRVRDLLLQAGNPKLTAYLKNAEITRIKKTGEAVTSYSININLHEAMKGNPQDNILLIPFDELIVRRIPNWSEETERYVTLSGEFVFPGAYPIYKGERLSDVIARAGGFTDNAYIRGAKFTRESVRKLQQERMDEALARAQEQVISKKTTSLSAAASKEELEAGKATLEGLERSIAILKAKKAEGRMIIKLANLEKFRGSPYDFEVDGGDVLHIPHDPKSVNVIGNVYNPSASLFEQRRDVAFYLDRVGGPTGEADVGEMYLVKADGTVYSHNQASSFLFYNGFLSANVDSGDTLVVPQRFEKTAWLRDIKDITTIISQIAISAGTVFLGLR
jgi:protein involved in polysaccharide export with SLBB domain